MDTLHDTEWDVVISGTGLTQSLLALSRKKILHLDRNSYYGGDEAALSLGEADIWAQQHANKEITSIYSHASIKKSREEELGSSRSYSIALAPQLIFTRSNILSGLVSSKTHSQLEFQAVGSWFVVDDGKLVRVPNGREDIFQDSTLDLRAKRALMKFIRHISDPEAMSSLSKEAKAASIPSYLEDKFALPVTAHAPIMALTLSPQPPAQTTVETALPNVVRHLQSIGLFGPGFGALTSKWGGLAEIAQVACRAGAVGGGVYVLGRGISSVEGLSLTLSDGEKVSTTWLVGDAEDMNIKRVPIKAWSRSVYIIAAPLTHLFPPTSEGGVMPAGAVIAIPAASDEPPVYAFVHTSDTGECPSGQCVLYASVALSHKTGFDRLQGAVQQALTSLNVDSSKIIWSMQFQHNAFDLDTDSAGDNVVIVNNPGFELALEDRVLDEVRSIWHKITGDDVEKFMNFGAREDFGADEEEETID